MEYKDTVLRTLTPDSFLGDSSQRYFSSNFKKVFHHINETKIENGKLLACCSVEWPEDWSHKKGVALQPHIGTLDFFLIASRLAEVYFEKVENLCDNQISNMWISEFHCKAGNKCIEQNTIFCECRLLSKKNQTEYTLDIKIADAVVVLKTQLPDKIEDTLLEIKRWDDFEQVSYYSAHYKEALRDITNIRIDTSRKNISADFELEHINKSSYKGIGSTYMPCVTFCDLVLVCGQLSQIILYHLDNTTREQASNLWLRNIHCFYKKPIKGKTNISVAIKASKALKLKGANYNCSVLIFNFNNEDLIAECSSAYQPFADEK